MNPNLALCANIPYQVVDTNKASEQDIRDAYMRNGWMDLVCEVKHDN